MALLIDIQSPEWMKEEELKDQLQPLMPDATIYTLLAECDPEKVTMLATVKLYPGASTALPSLQLVQKLGAGVDSMVKDPDLPAQVRIARLRPDVPAQEIAEYAVTYVLQEQRNIKAHVTSQVASSWNPLPPCRTAETSVAVLGLGHIGAKTASTFAALGFRVSGWSQSQKNLENVDCRAGDKELRPLLGEADYVVSILPSTDKTRDLFDRDLLASMKPGAVLINAGRGDLIVDEDLVQALNEDIIGGAVLDVFRQEPLSVNHPYWTHPKVTVTPHVSGWHLDDGLKDVAENYLRLTNGQPLLNEVDRDKGY
jgi:glyoxylate/hydroxypyruvate reductase A